jgi:predicted GIY-YIG superfamily endonuclease
MRKKWSDDSARLEIIKININFTPTEEYKNSKYPWKGFCTVCKKDISPRFSDLLFNQKACIHCSYKERSEKISNVKKYLNQAQEQGYTVKGSSRKNSGRKSRKEFIAYMHLQCPVGHDWSVSTNHWREGNRCPSCSKSGFDKNKKTYVYIIRNSNWVKLGITNNIESRLKKHKKNFTIIVKIEEFENGIEAIQIEKKWKEHIGNFKQPDSKFDGYTETAEIEALASWNTHRVL